MNSAPICVKDASSPYSKRLSDRLHTIAEQRALDLRLMYPSQSDGTVMGGHRTIGNRLDRPRRRASHGYERTYIDALTDTAAFDIGIWSKSSILKSMKAALGLLVLVAVIGCKDEPAPTAAVPAKSRRERAPFLTGGGNAGIAPLGNNVEHHPDQGGECRWSRNAVSARSRKTGREVPGR